jgi:hypothetical protein
MAAADTLSLRKVNWLEINLMDVGEPLCIQHALHR